MHLNTSNGKEGVVRYVRFLAKSTAHEPKPKQTSTSKSPKIPAQPHNATAHLQAAQLQNPKIHAEYPRVPPKTGTSHVPTVTFAACPLTHIPYTNHSASPISHSHFLKFSAQPKPIPKPKPTPIPIPQIHLPCIMRLKPSALISSLLKLITSLRIILVHLISLYPSRALIGGRGLHVTRTMYTLVCIRAGIGREGGFGG